jgi:hypothetical protein
MRKKLPIGIQTFREIREENHYYSRPPPKLDTRNSSRIRILLGRVTGVTCSLLGYDGSMSIKDEYPVT